MQSSLRFRDDSGEARARKMSFAYFVLMKSADNAKKEYNISSMSEILVPEFEAPTRIRGHERVKGSRFVNRHTDNLRENKDGRRIHFGMGERRDESGQLSELLVVGLERPNHFVITAEASVGTSSRDRLVHAQVVKGEQIVIGAFSFEYPGQYGISHRGLEHDPYDMRGEGPHFFYGKEEALA